MKNKSFTVIELLVVIAIIGLLASVVLVSLRGVRGEARITKALEFHQTVQNTLGAYAVGWWSFETIEPGNQIIDASGYGNNCTVFGGTTPELGLEQLGKALPFDGGNDYLDCGNGASLNPAVITLEAWIYPDAISGTRHIFSKHGAAVGDDSFIFRFDSNKLKFYTSHTGTENWHSMEASPPSAGEWSHIVATYAFDNTKKIFINGEEVASRTGNGLYTFGTEQLCLGMSLDYGERFNGLIDEVRIYERALSSAEIQKHYVQGLQKHQNLTIR